MKLDRRHLYPVLSLLVIAVFYGCFLHLVPFHKIREGLTSIPLSLLLTAFAVYLSIPIIRGRRLQLLTQMHHARLRMIAAVRITFLGFFFGSFATLIGADGAKTVMLRKYLGEGASAAAVVAKDRGMGILALILYMMLMLPLCLPALRVFDMRIRQISVLFLLLILSAGVLIATTLVCARFFQKKDPRHFTKKQHPLLYRLSVFFSDLAISRGDVPSLIRVFALSILELFVYLFYLNILLWDSPISFQETGIISIVELFIFAMPFLSQGLGAMEATMAFLLLAAGVPLETAASIPLVLRAFTLFSVLIGGLFFLVKGADIKLGTDKSFTQSASREFDGGEAHEKNQHRDSRF